VTSEPISVALVMDHPAQQFARALQLLSDEPNLQLQVCYWSVADRSYDAGFDRSVSWDVDLLAGYPWAAPASGWSLTRRLRWLVARFRVVRPAVVVCYGWASPIARASIIYCLLTRTRLLMYGDSTWQHSSRGWRPALRFLALSILLHLCAGAISTGTFNREFYIRHGMDPRCIWPGVCPADTETFGNARVADGGMNSPIDGVVRIGFAGKLIARKGVDDLLQATALLPPTYDWSVTVVGDGPLMRQLQDMAGQLGVDDRVTFHGFANTTEMPKLLAGFDVVVVPSRLDMRALITIEAMAAGAAIVVSDATAVWGPGDLVEHGLTGIVYPSGDPRALARELTQLISDRTFLTRIRQAGADRAAAYGPDAFARSTASAAQMSVAESARTRPHGRASATTGP
jgi:glycosyltransferase involved in cell wall biosynthesis